MTARRHASCSALAGTSPRPSRGASIDCGRCCSPAATLTGRCRAACSRRTGWLPSPAAAVASTRPANTRSGVPRSAGSPSPSVGSTELADNKRQLAELVTHLAPRLLAKLGVGPVSAAQAIVSWSHPGRCRDDAAYAALAGASPIPASSGRIVRHRLNRGGDHPRSLVLALSWRSPPREWRICGTRCVVPTTCSGSTKPAGVTSCSASSFWRGSSSPPASRTACGCWRRSGSSKFVRTARRYRTVQIRAGQQILTAADPLPHDLRDPLGRIHLCSRCVTGGSPLRTVEGSPGGTAQDRRHRPRRLRGRRPRRRPTRTSIYAVHGVGALSGQQ